MSNFLFLENNKIIYKNGVFAVAYKLELPEKYSLSQQDYDQLNSNWNSALKDLPINTIFYKQDVFIEEKFSTDNFKNENYLQKNTKEYYKNWNYLDHECNLFFLLPNMTIKNKNLINPFTKVSKQIFTDFDDNILSFIDNVQSTILFLENIKLSGNNKLKINPFSESEIAQYDDLYFNLFEKDFVSDIQVNNNNINVGYKYASMVCSLDENNLPDELNTTIKDNVLSNDKATFFKNYGENFSFNLGFTHIYNQIAIIDDNRRHLNDLRKRNIQLHKMKGFDPTNVFYAKETDEMIEDITKNIDTTKLIRGHNNVIVISENEEDLKVNVLKTIDAFKEIDIKSYVPTGNYLIALFNNSFPFYCQYLTEKQWYVSSLNIFCSFLNNTTEFKNNPNGVLYNSRLSNLPIKVDTWDEEKQYVYARNFFILAPTGSGKSVNANHIVRHYFEEKTKVVIVDLGGSYKKLAALYPNETMYITYKEGDSIPINPFELFDNELLNSDKIEELINFIAIHYKRDSNISEVEKTSLRKIVELFYRERKVNHSMVKFIEFVETEKNGLLEKLNINKSFFHIDEFLHSMSEFIGDGVYSFLYKEKEISFDNNIKNKAIIVFELDAVRSNPLLLTIMLNLVSTTIDKVIWKDKTTKGIVLFDEVAEQLKWEGVLKMIAYFYQAIRKQGGSVGMILQSESQLPDNEISKAIIENTQILYVLGAKDYKSLQRRFNLSEHAYYQLSSIQSNFSAKVPYSEIFILRGNSHQVYRLILPPKVFWAYQTEGIKNEKLLKIYEETNNMETAINKYLTLNN